MNEPVYCTRCQAIRPIRRVMGERGWQIRCARCDWIVIPAVSPETARLEAM